MRDRIQKFSCPSTSVFWMSSGNVKFIVPSTRRFRVSSLFIMSASQPLPFQYSHDSSGLTSGWLLSSWMNQACPSLVCVMTKDERSVGDSTNGDVTTTLFVLLK